eukprot:scaffold241_cov89-Cylindrotheca_fusiformis.AAC.1
MEERPRLKQFCGKRNVRSYTRFQWMALQQSDTLSLLFLVGIYYVKVEIRAIMMLVIKKQDYILRYYRTRGLEVFGGFKSLLLKIPSLVEGIHDFISTTITRRRNAARLQKMSLTESSKSADRYCEVFD